MLLCAVLGIGLLTGCSEDSTETGAHLQSRDIRVSWEQQQLYVQTGLELGLSKATIEALHSGVPLTISVDLRLGRRYGFWARELQTQVFHWSIRYLPLSEHYALDDPTTGITNSYPRLRTLLTAMRIPSRYATGITPELLGQAALNRASYQMQVRSRLNRLQLPAPLRLPALFSRQWRLGERWRTLILPAPPVDNTDNV